MSSECEHDDVGGCKVCERTLRAKVEQYAKLRAEEIQIIIDLKAEVATLRERVEIQDAGFMKYAREHNRDLAEARALLARIADLPVKAPAALAVDMARAFLRRDEAPKTPSASSK